MIIRENKRRERERDYYDVIYCLLLLVGGVLSVNDLNQLN